MSHICLKRVGNELSQFNKQIDANIYNKGINTFFKNLSFEICHVSENKYEKIIIEIKYNNKFLVDLSIPSDYPFKPYNIYRHNFSSNINFHKFSADLYIKMKSLDSNVLDFFYRTMYEKKPKFIGLNKTCCYACNSIICTNLWNPSCKIENFLLEYKEIMFIDKYSQKYTYKKIQNTYENMIHKFSIDYKLPDDVINVILGYIKIC